MKSYYDSPLGWLELAASDSCLQGIYFLQQKPSTVNADNRITKQAKRQLSEYFNEERKTFTLPLDPHGTDFQHAVWQQLGKIPYGQTISYGKLAGKLGNTNKVRAIGHANGQNPIPIIIPCHRVIGANNNLVGYAGGIERKKYLLKLEGALLL